MRALTVSTLALLLGLVPGTNALAEDTQTESEQEVNLEGNPVVFWELACHDAEESVEFFKKIFDWEIEKVPNSILYGVSSKTEDVGIGGGIFTLRKARLPFLTIYVLVDDIEKKAELIEESGGLIIEPPQEIFSGTWICLFTDPSGVTFAMLERTSAEE